MLEPSVVVITHLSAIFTIFSIDVLLTHIPRLTISIHFCVSGHSVGLTTVEHVGLTTVEV